MRTSFSRFPDNHYVHAPERAQPEMDWCRLSAKTKNEILTPQRKVRNQALGVSLSSAVSLYIGVSCCPRGCRFRTLEKSGKKSYQARRVKRYVGNDGLNGGHGLSN